LLTICNIPEIANHAYQVIKTLTFIQTETSAKDGSWYKVRIMPYRTLDDRIDGLVITFTDVTEAKLLEAKLNEAHNALKQNKEKE